MKLKNTKCYDSLSFNIKFIGVFGVSKNSNSISSLSQNVILNTRAICIQIEKKMKKKKTNEKLLLL